MARPTNYSEELAVVICTRLAEGEPLVKMCRDDEMPSTSTVYRWLASNDQFRSLYMLARQDQAHTMAAENVEIADDSSADMYVDADGVRRPNPAAVNRSKLKFEARRWYASKLLPKVYGDRTEIVGAEGEPLIPVQDDATTWRRNLETARRIAFVLQQGLRARQALETHGEPLLLGDGRPDAQ